MKCVQCEYTCHEDSFEITYVDFFDGCLCPECLEIWKTLRDAFLRAMWATVKEQE